MVVFSTIIIEPRVVVTVTCTERLVVMDLTDCQGVPCITMVPMNMYPWGVRNEIV